MNHNNAHTAHAATDDHEDNDEVQDNDFYKGEAEVEG